MCNTAFALVSVAVFAALVYAGQAFWHRKGTVVHQADSTREGEFSHAITTLQPYFWKFAMNSVTDYFYAKDTQGRYLGQNKSLLALRAHLGRKRHRQEQL